MAGYGIKEDEKLPPLPPTPEGAFQPGTAELYDSAVAPRPTPIREDAVVISEPPAPTPRLDDLTFDEAFATARKAGASAFEWRGKPYTTQLREEAAPAKSAAPAAKSGYGVMEDVLRPDTLPLTRSPLDLTPQPSVAAGVAGRKEATRQMQQPDFDFKKSQKPVKRAEAEAWVRARTQQHLREAPTMGLEQAEALALRELNAGGEFDTLKAPPSEVALRDENGTPRLGDGSELTVGAQAGRDLYRGSQNLQSAVKFFGATVADQLGLDEKAQELVASAQVNDAEAARFPALIGEWKNARSPDDYLRYAVEKTMENLPLMLPSLGGGTLAGMAGRKFAMGVIDKAVERKAAELIAAQGGALLTGASKADALRLAKLLVADEARAYLVKRAGWAAALGAAPGSYAVNVGDIAKGYKEATGELHSSAALAVGAPVALLDVVGDLPMLKAFSTVGNRYIANGVVRAMKNLGAGVVESVAKEMPTEWTQQVLQDVSTYLVADKPIDWAKVTANANEAARAAGVSAGTITAVPLIIDGLKAGYEDGQRALNGRIEQARTAPARVLRDEILKAAKKADAAASAGPQPDTPASPATPVEFGPALMGGETDPDLTPSLSDMPATPDQPAGAAPSLLDYLPDDPALDRQNDLSAAISGAAQAPGRAVGAAPSMLEGMPAAPGADAPILSQSSPTPSTPLPEAGAPGAALSPVAQQGGRPVPADPGLGASPPGAPVVAPTRGGEPASAPPSASVPGAPPPDGLNVSPLTGAEEPSADMAPTTPVEEPTIEDALSPIEEAPSPIEDVESPEEDTGEDEVTETTTEPLPNEGGDTAGDTTINVYGGDAVAQPQDANQDWTLPRAKDLTDLTSLERLLRGSPELKAGEGMDLKAAPPQPITRVSDPAKVQATAKQELENTLDAILKIAELNKSGQSVSGRTLTPAEQGVTRRDMLKRAQGLVQRYENVVQGYAKVFGAEAAARFETQVRGEFLQQRNGAPNATTPRQGQVSARSGARPTPINARDIADFEAAVGRADATARKTGAPSVLADGEIVPTQALPLVAPRGELDRRTGEFLEEIGRIVGRRVVFYKSSNPEAHGGFATANNDAAVFVNIKGSQGFVQVLGHEFVHGLKAKHPAIYAAMRAAIEANARNMPGYEEYYGADSRDYVEELMADAMGNQFGDSRFWADVFARVTELEGPKAKGIIERFITWANLFLGKLNNVVAQGKGDFEITPYLRDINAVKKAYTEAMSQYLAKPATQLKGANHGRMQGQGQETTQEVDQPTPRRRGFVDPEDRVEVSTTVPTVKGLEDAAYTENLVIDIGDVLASREYADKLAKAVSAYNTMIAAQGAPTSAVIQALHDTVVENLLWLHDRMPEAIRNRAKLWYDGANKIASDWSTQFNINLRQAAATLAIFSPQKDWFQNVSLAERTIRILRERGGERWTPAMTAWFESWVGASADMETKRSRERHLAHARGLAGKRLIDLNDYDAAVFIRAFDETYHPREYRLVTPEGGFGDFVSGATADAQVAWPGFDTVEKAVQVLRDGRVRVINTALGGEHKVRNFYNNIVSPNSADGHVTIDTHAIGAGLFKAMSGESLEVKHNFGGTAPGFPGAGKSGVTGASGTYAVFADAYREAARRRNLLPREMQSITWEAVRALFPAELKKGVTKKVEAVWDQYKAGKITREEARLKVYELAGGLRGMSWEGTPVGTHPSAGGVSFDNTLDADPTKRKARKLAPVHAKDNITVGLSAYTPSIKAFASLRARAQKGDRMAALALQDIASDGLKRLMQGLHVRITPERATGLYGGKVEPSLSLAVSFRDDERSQVLAALNKFAETFSQEQVHVRRAAKGKLGHVYPDGSYNTPVYTWGLSKPLTTKQVQAIIESSNLYGLTFGDSFVEAYYVGDTNDIEALARFETGARDAGRLIALADGGDGAKTRRSTGRLWAYGRGDGGIGWPGVHGDVSAEPGLRAEAVQRAKSVLAGQSDAASPQRSGGRVAAEGAGSQPGQGDRPEYGRATPGAVQVVGVHYSDKTRETLSGSYYGKGLIGEERARVFASPDERLRFRIYFYVNDGKGVSPEFGVGAHPHTVQLNNLYDLTADPKGLARGAGLNGTETAILNAGYDGYVADFGNQRAAVLIGRHHVDVRPEPIGYRGQDTPVGERAVPNPMKRLLQVLSGEWRSRTPAEWAKFTKEKAPDLYDEIGGGGVFTGEGYLWPDQVVAAVRAAQGADKASPARGPFGARRDEAYDLILSATGGGPFDGGCVTCAQGIQAGTGGELYVLVDDGDTAQHAVVKQGGRYVDFDGADSEAGIIRRFNRDEMAEVVRARPLREGDLPDAPRDPKAVKALAAMLGVEGRAKAFGFKAPPAVIERRQADNLDDIYAEATKYQAGFGKAIKEIARVLGVEALVPPDLKGRERAEHKINSDYDGDATQIKDILRASLVNESLVQAEAALEALKHVFPVHSAKNSFGKDTADGYRDAKVVVWAGNVKAEIQVHLAGVIAAKERMHDLYVQREGLTRSIKDRGEDWTPAALAEFDRLNAEMKKEYQPAFERSTKSRKAALSTGEPLRIALSNLKGLWSGSNAEQKAPPSGLGTSATGMSSTSKNLVPGGNSIDASSVGEQNKYSPQRGGYDGPNAGDPDLAELQKINRSVQTGVPMSNQLPRYDAIFQRWHDQALRMLKTAGRLPEIKLPMTAMPAVLRMVGMPSQAVAIGTGVLDKVKVGKHAKEMRSVAPEELNDILRKPALVFKVKTGPNAGDYEVVSDRQAALMAPEKGRVSGPLIMPLKNVVFGGVPYTAVKSAYGRTLAYDDPKQGDTINSRLRKALGLQAYGKDRNGAPEVQRELVYVDVSRLRGVYSSAGALFPEVQHAVAGAISKRQSKPGGGYIGVKTEDDLPRYIGDNYTGKPEFTPSFSPRRQIIGDSGRQYTPEQQAMFDAVGRAETKSAWDVLKRWANRRWTQEMFDQFAPLKGLSRQAYTLARLSKGASGAVEALLHHGKLSLHDGAYDADMTGGLLETVFYPLGKETTDFLYWVAGNRAERLAQEGRENLFNPQDILAAKGLASGATDFDYTLANGTVTRDRTAIYRDSLVKFNEFQSNVLDMAEQSGLIDGASRRLWEHDFYVPFYRVMDDEVRGGDVKKGLVRQEAFKALKGGKDRLNDLLGNTLMNMAHLIDASAKNRAAKEIIETAVLLNAAHVAQPGEKNTVWYMDGGQKQTYVVDDEGVMVAVQGLDYAGLRGPLWDLLTKPKHWLTVGVTASPFFKIRNLIRDSVQAVAVSGLSGNIAKNLAQGAKYGSHGNQEYVSALAGGGLIRFGTMLEGNEAARTRQLIKKGASDEHILDSEGKLRKFYDSVLEPALTAYNELGNRGEEINRMALYHQLIARGADHATASLMARDLMDFSLQGSSTTMRLLAQLVPFFNARTQGLYKLGRAAKDQPGKMAAVVGTAAIVSLALLAAYKDDEDWKKREEWDRDNYWWFKIGGKAYRIPKPFEVGAVATLAERSAEIMFDNEMTGERFREVTTALLANQLAMNPVPQAVKPILDIYANEDSFTKRPIETMAMERLESQYRYRADTSMAARGVSQVVMGALSPVQIDHLVQGYFGWLGTFVLGGTDMGIRMLSDEPTRPALDPFKFASGGMVAELDSGGSRYVTQMYKQAQRLEEYYNTYRDKLKKGELSGAEEYRRERAADIERYRKVESVKGAVQQLNKRIREIERSDMTPAEKRLRINAIRKQQDEKARSLSR